MTDCNEQLENANPDPKTVPDQNGIDAALRSNPLEDALLDLIGRTTSVAPRDVAEAVAKKGKDWRVYLPEIKSIAIKLEAAGRLVFVRKGRAVPSKGLKGVYRLARPDAPLKPARDGTQEESKG